MTSAADAVPSAPGTLRRALESSNSDGSSSRVVFAPALFGATVQLVQPLPTFRENGTTLDGTDGASTTPRITLRPASGQAGGIGSPLRIESNGNTLLGLALAGFLYTNVQIVNGGTNRVQSLAIDGGNTGITLDGALDCEVSSTSIQRSTGVSLEVLRSQRCVLGSGNSVVDAPSRAIEIDGASTGIEVRSSTVLRSAGIGIRVFGPQSIVAGNRVESAQSIGILVSNAGCSVRDNTVRLCGSTGILAQNVPSGALTEIGPGNVVESNSGHGIQLDRAPRVLVRDNQACRSHNLSGIRLDSSPDAVVRGNAGIDGNHQTGITVGSSSHRALIDGNALSGNQPDGMLVANSDDVVVSRCTNRTATAQGIYVVFSARARIGPGNTFEDCGGTGVLLDASAVDCAVENNAISRTGAGGVIALGSRARIAGNAIAAPTAWGIRVQSASACVLTANSVWDGRTDGIYIITVPGSAPTTVGPGNLVERCSGSGLYLTTSPGTIVIDNLAFRANQKSGIDVYDCPNLRCQGNAEIAENALKGIDLQGPSSNCLFERNTVRANVFVGMEMGLFSGLVLRDNTFRDQPNSAVQMHGVSNSLIEGNRFLDNGSAGLFFHPGCSNIRVLRNEIARNSSGVVDGTNPGNEYGWNRIYGQLGIGMVLNQNDAWVHDNLIWDNAAVGIETQPGSTGMLLVNNTVVGNGAGFFGDAEIWNCIFSDNGFDLFPSTSITSVSGTLIRNDFFGLVGANGNFSADPELVCIPPVPGAMRDPLHISNRSPCIDRARSGAPRVATTDIDGDPRPLGSAADVGADEASHALDAIPPNVSSSVGGTILLSLRSTSTRAGHPVIVLGSLSGTGPIPVGTTLLPLTYDPFFVITAQLAGTPAFLGFLGTLGASGGHNAYFTAPPGAIPAYAVGTLRFTFAWFDLRTLDFASNPTCVEITP